MSTDDPKDQDPSTDLPGNDVPLNPEDFKTLRATLDMVNNTTGSEFRKDIMIRLTQLLEKGMILEVPRRSCAAGHLLSLFLTMEGMPGKEKLELQTTCKVEGVESFDKGGDHVTVTLVQYDPGVWERLNQLFSSRQKDILDFFEAARGY